MNKKEELIDTGIKVSKEDYTSLIFYNGFFSACYAFATAFLFLGFFSSFFSLEFSRALIYVSLVSLIFGLYVLYIICAIKKRCKEVQK